MPKNKRESLIYTIMTCFTMVLWMSFYNVTIHMQGFTMETVKAGWLGFPLAFFYAICFDWFVISRPAKAVAFRVFVKPDSSVFKKVVAVSCCMVVPMVIVMSLYGSLESCVRTGNWNQLLMIWMTNIPINIIMALPFQMLIAGPLVRTVFRKAFPEGTVLEHPMTEVSL